MTRTELTNALRAAGIIFRTGDDHVFVDFRDAPEKGPKGKAMKKLTKACKFDIADKGVVFLV